MQVNRLQLPKNFQTILRKSNIFQETKKEGITKNFTKMFNTLH